MSNCLYFSDSSDDHLLVEWGAFGYSPVDPWVMCCVSMPLVIRACVRPYRDGFRLEKSVAVSKCCWIEGDLSTSK